MKTARQCQWIYHQVYLGALSFSAVCAVLGVKALIEGDLVLAFAAIVSTPALWKTGVFSAGLAKEWRDFQVEIKMDIAEIESRINSTQI